MLFPQQWTRVHPEHERFDVGFDIPDRYLPEFPPPLYLSTHPELGDVSRGVEITYGNYFNMMNGILTPEQLDGLWLPVTPFQTTWFNVTHHRVTPEPSEGVTCFSCHVNGHTNGAIELAPDSRPNYARLRSTRRPCAATTRSCCSPRRVNSLDGRLRRGRGIRRRRRYDALRNRRPHAPEAEHEPRR
jgi:hypothetical protein